MSDESQDIVDGDSNTTEQDPQEESGQNPDPDQGDPPLDQEPAVTTEEGADSAVTPEATVESVVEAILFASDEPVSTNRMSILVEVTTKQVNEVVDGLNQKYEGHRHAFRIERIAGGLQMLTLPQYNGYLKKLLRARDDSKLSPASLETLAIVAYKQPAIRADIEAIRGVACGEVLKSLMVKGLVKITGRAEIIGRPMQYGTTRRFLEVFGLNSLKDLPSIAELKRPDGPKAHWEKGSLIRETDLIPPTPQEESGSPSEQG